MNIQERKPWLTFFAHAVSTVTWFFEDDSRTKSLSRWLQVLSVAIPMLTAHSNARLPSLRTSFILYACLSILQPFLERLFHTLLGILDLAIVLFCLLRVIIWVYPLEEGFPRCIDLCIVF